MLIIIGCLSQTDEVSFIKFINLTYIILKKKKTFNDSDLRKRTPAYQVQSADNTKDVNFKQNRINIGLDNNNVCTHVYIG